MSVLKHREHSRLPRHLQSHTHLGLAQEAAECAKPDYPACAKTAAHVAAAASSDASARLQEQQGEAISASASASTLEAFIEKREAACETWLNEFATSVKQNHYVTSALAYGTFAPNAKESLTEIFAKYSGARE